MIWKILQYNFLRLQPTLNKLSPILRILLTIAGYVWSWKQI